MNPLNFDLNLLRVFVALYKTRKVSDAAQIMGLTQPAMSNALKRLRQHCNDPLFVRMGQEMVPTDLANAMAGPFHDAIKSIEQGLARSMPFDPSSSEHTFRILSSDVGERVILPPLMQRIHETAPRIRVVANQIAPAEYAQALKSGLADLAIGNLTFIQQGYYQQHLFDDNYVCITREGHPLGKEPVTLARYLACDHVMSKSGNADRLVDQELAKCQQRRVIKLEIAHYYGCATVVSQSDLIATVPKRVVEGIPRIQQLPLPLQIPAARVRQFWHRRSHQDPANQWLRQSIADIMQASH